MKRVSAKIRCCYGPENLSPWTPNRHTDGSALSGICLCSDSLPISTPRYLELVEHSRTRSFLWYFVSSWTVTSRHCLVVTGQNGTEFAACEDVEYNYAGGISDVSCVLSRCTRVSWPFWTGDFSLGNFSLLVYDAAVWLWRFIAGSCHKYHFCRDKSFFRVCCDKTRLLARPKYAFHDKTLVATNIFL